MVLKSMLFTCFAREFKNSYEPETLMEVPASMMPLFGRTQYLRGAVVLTLKHTFLSVGLVSFRVAVTTSVNGPGGKKKSLLIQECKCVSVRMSLLIHTLDLCE